MNTEIKNAIIDPIQDQLEDTLAYISHLRRELEIAERQAESLGLLLDAPDPDPYLSVMDAADAVDPEGIYDEAGCYF